MRTKRLVVVVITLAAMALPATAGAVKPPIPGRYVSPVFTDVTVTSDIAYGEAVNDEGVLETLELDIYEPKGDKLRARPAFVWVHGGSMVGGDKASSMEREIGNAFARRGWVVASVNYRLMSQFFPADCPNDIVCATGPRLPLALKDGQHDVQAAVRYLRKNAAALRVDPDQIMAGGHSAGTALALLANFNPEDPGDSGNPGYPSNISATMTNSGTLLEPSTIGPGEPPIIMFNSVNDADLTLWVGQTQTCIPTTLVGNVCEFHGYVDGGHSLSKHRPEIIQKTAEFFCRRVLTGCVVDNPTTDVGPTGSTWDGNVHCASDQPVAVADDGSSAEVCAEDAGRAYVTGDTVQVDGDEDNPLVKSSLHYPGDPAAVADALSGLIVGGLTSFLP